LSNNAHCVSIYIANVPLVIDALNYWDSLSKRTATIYLPDKKRPMLPPILSDWLCSLQAGVVRAAFHMDLYICGGCITDIKFGASLVNLYKNYCYEEPDLLNNPEYTLLTRVTREMNSLNKYLDFIGDSHDVVCYLMILMNYYCAKKMLEHGTGIFRSTIVQPTTHIIPPHVPGDVSKFLKILRSTRGQYVTSLTNIRHDALGLDAYIHITSPIRRLVDLLNMAKFQQITGIVQFPEKVSHFYQTWAADLEYINVTMKSIRSVQNECNLLALCTNSPELLEREHVGYIQHGDTAAVNPHFGSCFAETFSKGGLPNVDYKVYLPELKLITKFQCDQELYDYQCAKFKLYLFHDEDNLQRKIRVQLQT
jgi:exoribonuclease R